MSLLNCTQLHLNNCNFANNMATLAGGAIHLEFELLSDVLLSNSIFTNNVATNGGGMYSTSAVLLELVLENCTFWDNMASETGGALFFNETSTKIADSKFWNNTSPTAGAVYFSGLTSVLHIAKSSFCKHSYIPHPKLNFGAGAAVMAAGTMKIYAKDVVFEENTSGGALSVANTQRAEVHNAVFYRNKGDLSGAIVTQNTLLYVNNTSIMENTASRGSALFLANTNCLIQSCHFAGNTGEITHTTIKIRAKTTSLQFRSYNNIFIDQHSQYPEQNYDQISLSSATSQTIPAKVYFWQNRYKFSDNKTKVVDRQFLNNISMPKIVYVHEHVNFTEEYSQFASGGLNQCHTKTGKNFDLIFDCRCATCATKTFTHFSNCIQVSLADNASCTKCD